MERDVIQNRIASIFGSIVTLEKESVRRGITELALSRDDIPALLSDPGTKPYGRRLLYKSRLLEVIAMTWSANRACLPHDHGDSSGWVQVLRGHADHRIYATRRSGAPSDVAAAKTEPEGELIWAPAGLVHEMENAASDALVTVHFYFPPITGMTVYDIETHRAAVVTDDCGAWWPDAGQQIRIVNWP